MSTYAFRLANKKNQWEAILNEKGQIKEFRVQSEGRWHKINFRSDDHGGPTWYQMYTDKIDTISLHPTGHESAKFEGQYKALSFSLEYTEINDQLAIIARIRNEDKSPFCPTTVGIKLGLDCFMEKYPEWNDKYFPTLLRCEKTHFWGYAMTPERRILGICSPDPIASWSLDYNYLKGNNKDTEYGGHRIYTLNLDLLNELPLPTRHPQNLSELQPGEERQWTIFLFDIRSLEEVKSQISTICRAPIFEIDRYTLGSDESCQITIFSDDKVNLKVGSPNSGSHELPIKKNDENIYYSTYAPEEGVGTYTLVATNASGKQSEAKVYLRQPWSWYLKQARKEAIRPQREFSGFESWHGFYSIFLARKHFPNKELDDKAEANWKSFSPLFFNSKKKTLFSPPVGLDRITNGTYLASLFADRYQCTKNSEDLENAAALIEILIEYQRADGGYYTPEGILYTSVGYAAKSVMEVALEEKKLSSNSEKWRRRYQRHYESAKAAIDNLMERLDDVETEGEQTFEDGMISGTALQLAMFALLEEDPEAHRKYTEAAIYVMRKHHCLEQLLIPDCRMSGATLRFWEAQYDVLIKTPNMMNSPHGWGGQKLYATWYLYQLTGEESWLRDLMNTLGSCMQLISIQTGKLRWSFVPDPYVRAKVVVKDPNTGRPIRVDQLIGEQYVDMIGDWYVAPTNTGYDECGENIVHEVFKGLEEVALTSAYILERNNGEIISWNCRVEFNSDVLNVKPSESIVSSVHFNLKHERNVRVYFADETVSAQIERMKWIRKPSLKNGFWPPDLNNY